MYSKCRAMSTTEGARFAKRHTKRASSAKHPFPEEPRQDVPRLRPSSLRPMLRKLAAGIRDSERTPAPYPPAALSAIPGNTGTGSAIASRDARQRDPKPNCQASRELLAAHPRANADPETSTAHDTSTPNVASSARRRGRTQKPRGHSRSDHDRGYPENAPRRQRQPRRPNVAVTASGSGKVTPNSHPVRRLEERRLTPQLPFLSDANNDHEIGSHGTLPPSIPPSQHLDDTSLALSQALGEYLARGERLPDQPSSGQGPHWQQQRQRQQRPSPAHQCLPSCHGSSPLRPIRLRACHEPERPGTTHLDRQQQRQRAENPRRDRTPQLTLRKRNQPSGPTVVAKTIFNPQATYYPFPKRHPD
ncbi:hypothetical protein VTK26DRAFT_2811 [Humicola hyalothermophila]